MSVKVIRSRCDEMIHKSPGKGNSSATFSARFHAFISNTFVGKLDRKYVVEVIRTRDGELTSYHSYCTWSRIDRIKDMMPGKTSVEEGTYILTDALSKQLHIYDNPGHISVSFKESLKLLMMQAWAHLSDKEQKCKQKMNLFQLIEFEQQDYRRNSTSKYRMMVD